MVNEVIMPAGSYYIGDPCYYVPEHLWGKLLENSGFFEKSPIGEIEGFKILAISTEYGDGVYTGSDGRIYPVDSGTIGLTPAELVEKKDRVKKHLINFSNDVICSRKGGLITIGNIKIETGFTNDDEDGFDEYN